MEKPKYDVYISSSWKQRERVGALACGLIAHGVSVYDFTNPACRDSPEIPPEKFPQQFDPEIHSYREYINKPEWRAAVECNRRALDACKVVILLLPCGNDAHADWAYAVGRGAYTIVVGHPNKDERTPSHLWCDSFIERDEEAIGHVALYLLANDDVARAQREREEAIVSARDRWGTAELAVTGIDREHGGK